MALSTREVFLILRARDEASRVLRGFSGNLKDLDKDTLKSAQRQMAHGQAMSSVGIGLAAAGAAAAAFFKTAVDSSIEYTRQAAYTKTQTDKVNVSISQLKDIGREVGMTVPTDFDKIQTSLYDIFSSIDVTLPQAKRLLKEFATESVAGQESLQEAGKGTIGIMNAFKIPIEKVRTVSDTMFQLVRKGVGTYAMFNRTIGRAVPSAVRAGQSFQDLAGMMAFLTRNGISTAMAAASAGRALDAFANPKVVGRLEAMGIKVRNAKGEFLPISQVVTALGKSMKGLTSPDRAAALQALFKGAGGTIQARRFYDIAVKNYDKLNQYTAQMKNSKGTLKEAYDIMFKQPQSQAILLSNNMKIMKTLVGDALVPAWLKLTGAIIKVVQWFNHLDPHMRNMIVKGAALAATLAIVGGGLLAVVGVILMFTAAMTMADIALLPIIGIIALVIAGLVALGVAIFFVIKYHNQIWAFMKKVWGDAVRIFYQVRDAIWAVIRGPLMAIIGWFQNAAGVVANVGKAIGAHMIGPLKEIGGWFRDAGGYVAKWAKETLDRFLKALSDAKTAVIQVGKDIWAGIGPGLTMIWKALVKGAQLAWAVIRPALEQLMKALPVFGGLLSRLFRILGDRLMGFLRTLRPIVAFIGKVFLGSLTLLQRAIIFLVRMGFDVLKVAIFILIGAFKLIAPIVAAVLPPVLELVGKIIARIINILRGLITFVLGVLTGDWGKAWSGIKTIMSNTLGIIKDLLVGAVKIIVGIFKGLVKGIVDLAVWLWNKLVGHSIFPDIARGIISWFRYILSVGPRMFMLFVNSIVAGARIIITRVVQLTRDMVAPFATAARWLLQRGREFVQGLMSGILGLARTIGSWVYNNLISPLVAQFKGANKWIVQKGRDVIWGFLGGLQAVWNEVTKWIGTIATWIKDHKGPVSLDAKLLVPAGQAIMHGFLTGLKSGAGKTWEFVKSVGGKTRRALEIAQGLRDVSGKVISGIGKALGNVGSTSLSWQGTAGVERWRAIALKALAITHSPASWIGSLLRRMNQESGGRPDAINLTDINAQHGDPSRGLMQTIGATFAAYKRAGVPQSSIWDPLENIIASINYANARYGAAPRGWDRPGGYEQGAWKILNKQLAWLHRGEMVVPAVPAESIRNRYNGGDSGSGGNTYQHFDMKVYTNEIDPRKHAADLGWEFANRVS